MTPARQTGGAGVDGVQEGSGSPTIRLVRDRAVIVEGNENGNTIPAGTDDRNQPGAIVVASRAPTVATYTQSTFRGAAKRVLVGVLVFQGIPACTAQDTSEAAGFETREEEEESSVLWLILWFGVVALGEYA